MLWQTYSLLKMCVKEFIFELCNYLLAGNNEGMFLLSVTGYQDLLFRT